MVTLEKIIALAKRRGFFYPSSEIYGGLANTWDFGHYGVLLKNNLRDLWWKRFVMFRSDMVGVEASIFLPSSVWEASGHVAGFSDSLVDCKNCKRRMRADHLIEEAIENVKVEGLPLEELTSLIKKYKITCPYCKKSEFTDVRRFNLLFQTHLGIVEESKSLVYLRGEIAQGIFLNVKNVLDTNRVRIPFGIAQQGKAFRNEITMGQGVHRTIEFDLMEFEYFIRESEWNEMYEMWRGEMWEFAIDIGLNEKSLRWREHEAYERSFYSTKTMDIEYKYPFGWKEMWGIAYRTNYDLTNHSKHSGKKLEYRDPKTGERFIPHVIEPTFGLSRLIMIVLFDSYREQQVNGKIRTYLDMKAHIAPIKTAIFPLQKDEKLQKPAFDLYTKLKKSLSVEFDDSGNIGQMYRRQDEIGTPYCITFDFQTLKDRTVTIRERNTMKQERIQVNKVERYIKKKVDVKN